MDVCVRRLSWGGKVEDEKIMILVPCSHNGKPRGVSTS